MKTIQEQLIEKQKELILKLQSMVDSQQDYDRDYHEIWMETAALESQTNQSKISIMPTDEEITKAARIKCMDENFLNGIGALSQVYFINGAKWCRDQIEEKLKEI